VRFHELVDVSLAVARNRSRLEKTARLAELLRRMRGREILIGVAYLSGSLVQGRVGLGWSAIAAARTAGTAAASSIDLLEVDAIFERIAHISGPGSARARARLLADLFSRATPDEQDFLARLISGDLRQGALEGVLSEAIAKAADTPADQVRHAAMMCGDLGEVAHTALTDGGAALASYAIQLFRPVEPMLASPAENATEALGWLGEAAFELKLDGARIQVHKAGEDVRVFSRGLNDVTSAVPEVVDGRVLTMEPQRTRFATLVAAVPTLVVPHRIIGDPEGAEQFLYEALAAGHEGLMAKALNAPYAAGSRGRSWLKIKIARTLDLVVLAAEWGSGRRRGRLSNLHLGARDAGGGFVMLGKTFKGLTDEVLEWQTAAFLERETGREGHVVFVRPELVVEIAFSDIQESPHYPGGLALRFARVKGYRADKTAAQADTIATVREMYQAATGRTPSTRA
jgi:DNA ligase-1